MTGILKSLQSARPGTDFVANEKYLKYFQVFKNCTAREHFPPAWLIDLFSGSGVLLVKGSPSLVKQFVVELRCENDLVSELKIMKRSGMRPRCQVVAGLLDLMIRTKRG